MEWLVNAWSSASLIAAALPDWYWLSVCGTLGLLVGSFLNVVILRLPPRLEHRWRSIAAEYLDSDLKQDFSLEAAPPGLVMERSHCPNCGYKLKAYHNIPLISYLFLGGKCAGCKQRISIQYPAVEALTMLLSLACFWRFGATIQCFWALIISWMLVAMSGIDWRTKLLPDELTQPLLWLGLLLSVFEIFVSPYSAILGTALGWGVLAGLNAAYAKVRGREGMGGGDFVLLGALGAWCGATALPLIVLMSAAVGALAFLFMMILGRYGKDTEMPFGPYLAAAGWIYLIFGEAIQNRYYQLMTGG